MEETSAPPSLCLPFDKAITTIPTFMQGNNHKEKHEMTLFLNVVDQLDKPGENVSATKILNYFLLLFQAEIIQEEIPRVVFSQQLNFKLSLPQGFDELFDITGKIATKIACEVINDTDLHSIVIDVLNTLEQFSWETKVALTLATYTLTFGDSGLNLRAESEVAISKLPLFLKQVLELMNCMTGFEKLPRAFLTSKNVDIMDARTHFIVAVYWIIRDIVQASASHILRKSSRGGEFDVVDSTSWVNLEAIEHHLTEKLHEDSLKILDYAEEEVDIEAYNKIKEIIFHEKEHSDNMTVLNLLFSATGYPLYDGPGKKRVQLDVLRSKNVLLLISDLNISQEELYILETSCTESKVHAYEIVWIPVRDPSVYWTYDMQAKLEMLQRTMPWYSVHHVSMTVIKFIKEDWHFRGRPIVVVLDPQGRVLSPNAIHMMWIWQSQAFPFTSSREQALWEQETWRLELLVNGFDPTILDWIRDEKCIFVFGGDDIEWIRKFTREAHAVARALQVSIEMVYVGRSHNKEAVRLVTNAIVNEQMSHCWQDPSLVWFFWKRINSMIFSKFQLQNADKIMQEIKSLHSYEKFHEGWVILAKGSQIEVHGHCKVALVTLQELEEWKERAIQHGFHVGYREHYHINHRKYFPCHDRIEFPASVKFAKVLICAECGRHMQKCKSFICCHEG